MEINDNVTRALLCEKAELLRDSVKATDPGAKEILRKAMAEIDRRVDNCRTHLLERERRASAVVTRWTRKVA